MSIIEHALKKLQVVAQEPDLPDPAVTPPGVILELPSHHGESSVGRAAARFPRRIVQLDREALVGAGFLAPPESQRQVADQFRHVKRPLLAAALGRGVEPVADGCVIMITSSLPDEGKTFVSFNLAMSMSLEREISVVYVDADVAKRHVSQLFGIDREMGLLDAVQDENLDIESLVLPTSFSNLSVLPAGKPTDTATELLASHRMETIVAKLSVGLQSRRVILFDSPPLLLTSESRAIARHVGQIVLVVRAAMTPQSAVFDAINCLGRERSINLLLNQSESAVEAGYYYHGSTYGQYAKSTASAPPEANR